MRKGRGDSVQERIVALIHDRRLAAGAPMPTEPQLMELLGASRNSVREAVRALQALGIVEIRHGYGTFVGTGSLQSLGPSLEFRIRSASSRGVAALRDLVEVRSLLEVGMIARVAESVTPARLSALDALVTALRTDPEADRAFHALLYESCGNELVLQLIDLFWQVYHQMEDLVEKPGDRTEAIVVNHRQVVEALRARDARAAQDAMRRHFRDLTERIDRAAQAAEATGAPAQV
jgi:DNA-binding FadR family transcriptional regulator